ncbi:MAG TPA: diguanylate cyclase [Candidatus Rifleibacterium sp.]|mgnify:CR=1 FL=1|nr:diguanylate cyclase [Candidatus Rifleibacterium sp.]HPT45797.1 diguanylate cyclase [Candidatus Rifleibacterium sp.]
MIQPAPAAIDYKSRLNEPQVWIFLFVFFAAIPLFIYYQTYSLHIEDNFNRQRASMVQTYQRELNSFGARSTNRQIFLQLFQGFRDNLKRNYSEKAQHESIIKTLLSEVPESTTLIIWGNHGRVDDNSIIKTTGLASDSVQNLVSLILNAYDDYSTGINLQSLHQIKKFEQQHGPFFAAMTPLLGRGFPVSQALTSPNKITGNYMSTSEVFFFWDFFNKTDNSLGGFAAVIPLRNLSPVFGLQQVLSRETGSTPESVFGYFDQTSGEVAISYQPLLPVAKKLVKEFETGLANPLFVGDWVIFVQPHPDSSSASVFSMFSTSGLRAAFESDLYSGRLIFTILLMTAIFIFYYYFKLTKASGMSLRRKMAAIFFMCMQLPVSILIFLGIRFSISQGTLLHREAETRLQELIKRVDADTGNYYRSVNEWLKSIRTLPEMVNLDKQRLRETFFKFSKNDQVESFYLTNLNGDIEFDIDNLAGENASNRLFIKELGMRILAFHSGDESAIPNLNPLDDGLFELVTRRTGVMHQVFWPGSDIRKFAFSDVVTAADGRVFASITILSKTELDRRYLRQAVNNHAQLYKDSELFYIKQDDIADNFPKLTSVFKANLLSLIAASNYNNNITTDLLADENEPMLAAVGRGINARDFLIGARSSWNSIMETIHFTYLLVGFGLLCSLAASLFLITILIKEFLAPVSILSNGARAISNGDLELNLPVFAKDELGELSTIFNLMTRRLRNRLTELTVLYNLTQKASTTHSQREIFELAAENLQEHLNAESAGTVWVSGTEGSIELFISENPDVADAEAIKNCAKASLRSCRETLETESTSGKHILSLPLYFEDRKFGAIYLVFAPERFTDKKSFSDDEKNFMDTLRHHLGLIIENQRLFEEAITDSLTRLYLRRFFLATLDKEISRSKRYQLDLGLMMLDIDNFKKFNDTHGHQAGDYVLRETAQRLIENIRTVDTPGRYGGEEIALLLPQTGIKEAFVVAERIRKAIEGSEYVYRDAHMRVTVSIGVSSLHLRNLTMEELVDEADRALYVAKNKGRNQVFIAPEAM